jgi:hypothetical protein
MSIERWVLKEAKARAVRRGCITEWVAGNLPGAVRRRGLRSGHASEKKATSRTTGYHLLGHERSWTSRGKRARSSRIACFGRPSQNYPALGQ